MAIRTTSVAAALAATLLLSSAATAGVHSHHNTATQCKLPMKKCAMKSYMHANHVMHQGMDIRYTGNADVDFAAGMIPHHQGAIDMAKVQLQFGKDEELKKLARWIITWQEAEIGFMKQWLAGRQGNFTAEGRNAEASVKGYKSAMETMHRDMDIRYSRNADIDFARGMIPHHQGAIDMAWVLKKYGMDPKLRDLADEIIRSQAQEIKLMQEWLDKHSAPEKPKKKHKKHGNAYH